MRELSTRDAVVYYILLLQYRKLFNTANLEIAREYHKPFGVQSVILDATN